VLQGDSSIEAVSTIPIIRITAHPIMPVLNGFLLFRFLADNVGYWLVHCHMSWHNHLGMAIILKVFLEFLFFMLQNVCYDYFYILDVKQN
jgi:hypothetical protein